MTLKNAALLALIGTILMTAHLLWTFVFTFLNFLRGVVPAIMLFQSFVYAFGFLQRDGVLLRVPPGAAVVILRGIGRCPSDSPAAPNTAAAGGHYGQRCPRLSSAR
jgi:hypothetical protein